MAAITASAATAVGNSRSGPGLDGPSSFASEISCNYFSLFRSLRGVGPSGLLFANDADFVHAFCGPSSCCLKHCLNSLSRIIVSAVSRSLEGLLMV